MYMREKDPSDERVVRWARLLGGYVGKIISTVVLVFFFESARQRYGFEPAVMVGIAMILAWGR